MLQPGLLKDPSILRDHKKLLSLAATYWRAVYRTGVLRYKLHVKTHDTQKIRIAIRCDIGTVVFCYLFKAISAQGKAELFVYR